MILPTLTHLTGGTGLSKITQNSDIIDLSNHDTVFCDSIQALDWAYRNGLPKMAIIKSNAPSLLWKKNPNIHNIEERWNVEELKKFQNTIPKLSIEAFDAVYSISGIEREMALVILYSIYSFQKVIYKAACLSDDDFTRPRLFIYVDGKTGAAGNIMNTPWDEFLQSNPLFSKIIYTLKDDDWKILTTQGVSYLKRFKLAGIETTIYRLAMKFMKKIPDWVFTKEVLIPNENELNIEIASSLSLRGVKISKIQLEDASENNNIVLNINTSKLYEIVLPIIRTRVKQFVAPSAVDLTVSMFVIHLEKQIKQFGILAAGWDKAILVNKRLKQSVLANAIGNINGLALSYVCKNNNIPLICSQHGITGEISRMHNLLHPFFDNTVADAMFFFNSKFLNISKNIYYNKSRNYMVGMPLRIIRMRFDRTISKQLEEIVYISTNLYSTGFSLSLKTDYIQARSEQDLILEVLSKLPHKVCYKTYPEDNRRYADVDPVLDDVKRAENMELFSNKIDMRYLLYKYKIFITTGATSTLGWPIMSDKPVVFINQKYRYPLTSEAYDSFSKGIFVFNDSDQDFHRKLRSFLSQPIDKIERLWDEKKEARKNMVRNYFSTYKDGGAGKRAAKIILREYLN